MTLMKIQANTVPQIRRVLLPHEPKGQGTTKLLTRSVPYARPLPRVSILRPLSSPLNIEKPTRVNPISQQAYNLNHEAYELYRSSYPGEAIELCASLAGEGQHTLEVAAGTGKFTSQILQILPTARYIATDPSPGMAQTFQKKLPQVKFVQTSSSKLPFESNSFDVIYIAQAFHWFANEDSLLEFSRVLRPGGKLVMLWNFEDVKNMPLWQQLTTNAVWEYDKQVPQYRKGDWAKVLKDNTNLFDTFCERYFPYKVKLSSPQALWDYWKTRSYVTALDEITKGNLKHRIFDITRGEKSLVASRGCHVVWLTKSKEGTL